MFGVSCHCLLMLLEVFLLQYILSETTLITLISSNGILWSRNSYRILDIFLLLPCDCFLLEIVKLSISLFNLFFVINLILILWSFFNISLLLTTIKWFSLNNWAICGLGLGDSAVILNVNITILQVCICYNQVLDHILLVPITIHWRCLYSWIIKTAILMVLSRLVLPLRCAKIDVVSVVRDFI